MRRKSKINQNFFKPKNFKKSQKSLAYNKKFLDTFTKESL